MLTRLTVKNYALISELDVEFGPGLTIITGETGAGKSILLGALGLVLGQRADLATLLDKKKKCTVEAWFDLSSIRLSDFFTSNDLDEETVTCLRREINPEGRSRAFINDTPVSVSLLRELADRLIDIHSQHENLLLQDSGFRLSVIDSIAGSGPMVATFGGLYKKHLEMSRKLETIRAEEQQSRAQADYLSFQLNELSEASLRTGEMSELESEFELLRHSEEIKQTLGRVSGSISGDGDNLLSAIQQLISAMIAIGKLSPKAAALHERLTSLKIELQDIGDEAEALDRSVQADPRRLESISNRLDILNRLLNKHRVADVDELINLQDSFAAQLGNLTSLTDQIAVLEKSISDSEQELTRMALAIRKHRKDAIPPAEKRLKELLKDVGMVHAGLKFDLKETEGGTFRSDGMDQLSILFSANKGVEFRDLSKVASGGEMARLMLCIKALIAHSVGLPTLVFDEIDTGISGEVAGRVGTIVKSISSERQVIAITHLPQMAAKGDLHLHVYKLVKGETTQTAIRSLSDAERVTEIAKMLSGDEPSKAAIANARELLV